MPPPGAPGDGRGINRHDYTRDEISAARCRPVVQRLERLIRLRNVHPAFGGDFGASLAGPNSLLLCWSAGEARAALSVDLRRRESRVELTGAIDGPQCLVL